MTKIKKSPSSPKPPLNLTVLNSQRKIPVSPASVKQVVVFLLEKAGIWCEELSIHFVGKQRISSLHAEFFDDPSITDCITFPSDPPSKTCQSLGDIFVCPEVARAYAKKHGEDLYQELTLYVVHGFLHLLGYLDTPGAEEEKMRRAEKKWMRALAKNHLSITP